MGHLTTFVLTATLRHDAPVAILSMINDRVRLGEGDAEEVTRRARWRGQGHPFFETERCAYILTEYRCNGSEAPGIAVEERQLRCSTVMKNYDQEIQLFLDWISPAVEPDSLEGFVQGEDWDCARPFAWRDGKIVIDWMREIDAND